MGDMRLKKRVLDIAHKNKLSHLGSYFSSLDIIDYIFEIKEDDDIFILSCGHCAVSLYAVIEKYYDIDAEMLFNKHGGHPHRDEENHIYCSTGSLGMGLPVAVGRAIANPDRDVYCLISDGECAEGSIWEALSFIKLNKIDNLKVFVNVNGYAAYDKVNINYLIKRLKIFLPSIETIFTTVEHFPFLKGLNAHYKVMNEEDYDMATGMLELMMDKNETVVRPLSPPLVKETNHGESFRVSAVLDKRQTQPQTLYMNHQGTSLVSFEDKTTLCEYLSQYQGNYLEIGCFDGVTLSYIAETNKNKICYGIDPFMADGHVQENLVKRHGNFADMPKQRENLHQNIQSYKNIKFFEMTSEEFSNKFSTKELQDMNVSVFLVDGCHLYDYIMIDWNLCLRMIGDRSGYIHFDDYTIPDVKRAVDDLEKHLKENDIAYELVTTSWWPKPSSVGIKIVGVE